MPSTPSRLPWYTLIVGLLIVLAFGWLCFFMLQQAIGLEEKAQFRWDRFLLIFNSVQALAAAAAGALLGTSVQQARVTNAEAAAEKNAGDAAKAKAARQLVTGLQAPGAAAPSAATLAALAGVLN